MKNNKQIFVEYLEKLFPNAVCELDYKTPFQLLVAVILSAQCTDKRVNMTTPLLFEKFSTPQDFASANLEEIEQIIKPCGFYHNKAKNIKNASTQIMEKFNGQIPTNMQDMMTLSGVGMKTAKVVCSILYNEKVIAVDTHVRRVSNRIGFVNEQNPDKCSVKLEKLFKDDLSKIHHRMVFFGRYHCKAINPNCEQCELKSICKYYKTIVKN
ncbi:MAG: endonuclease III [Clostridia bacterium]|nr:endonuclease III [Clostridia bacterium]